MNYAFRSVARSGRITAVVLAAVASMTVFLSAFAGGIAKNRAELDRLCEAMTVTAGVTGYRDAPTASLSQEQYGKIMDSGFVRTKSAMIQKTVNDTCALRAMDSMELEPELLGWAPYITWAEGWDAEKFFAGEAVCLVPRACEVALGATFSFRLGGGKKLPPLEMRVVGLYGEAYGSARNAVFYCPLAAMETWLGDNGEKIVYNKLEMELQDLRHLDTFKQEMKAAGLDKGSSQLVIHDALFQRVTRQFRQQIRLMNTLLPVLLAITAGIGFGLSFLLLQGRKKEAAVLRSLGMRRGQVAGVFLTESAARALAGVALGGALAWAILGATAFQPGYLALVLVCFLLGGAAAVWKISGINVFTILTARE